MPLPCREISVNILKIKCNVEEVDKFNKTLVEHFRETYAWILVTSKAPNYVGPKIKVIICVV